MALKTAKLTRLWKICRIIHQKFCIQKFFCNFALNINNPQSLKGLQILDCSENQLYSLNVQENKELISLDCAYNDLHNDLYLGSNIKLKNLDCRKNINLYSITISDGQYIENVLSNIRPTTSSYRQYLEWRKYKEEQLNDFGEDEKDWEDQRLDAFEGDENNYWNID